MPLTELLQQSASLSVLNIDNNPLLLVDESDPKKAQQHSSIDEFLSPRLSHSQPQRLNQYASSQKREFAATDVQKRFAVFCQSLLNRTAATALTMAMSGIGPVNLSPITADWISEIPQHQMDLRALTKPLQLCATLIALDLSNCTFFTPCTFLTPASDDMMSLSSALLDSPPLQQALYQHQQQSLQEFCQALKSAARLRKLRMSHCHLPLPFLYYLSTVLHQQLSLNTLQLDDNFQLLHTFLPADSNATTPTAGYDAPTIQQWNQQQQHILHRFLVALAQQPAIVALDLSHCGFPPAVQSLFASAMSSPVAQAAEPAATSASTHVQSPPDLSRRQSTAAFSSSSASSSTSASTSVVPSNSSRLKLHQRLTSLNLIGQSFSPALRSILNIACNRNLFLQSWCLLSHQQLSASASSTSAHFVTSSPRHQHSIDSSSDRDTDALRRCVTFWIINASPRFLCQRPAASEITVALSPMAANRSSGSSASARPTSGGGMRPMTGGVRPSTGMLRRPTTRASRGNVASPPSSSGPRFSFRSTMSSVAAETADMLCQQRQFQSFGVDPFGTKNAQNIHPLSPFFSLFDDSHYASSTLSQLATQSNSALATPLYSPPPAMSPHDEFQSSIIIYYFTRTTDELRIHTQPSSGFIRAQCAMRVEVIVSAPELSQSARCDPSTVRVYLLPMLSVELQFIAQYFGKSLSTHSIDSSAGHMINGIPAVLLAQPRWLANQIETFERVQPIQRPTPSVCPSPATMQRQLLDSQQVDDDLIFLTLCQRIVTTTVRID